MQDVIVVGGGIIGLLCARALLAEGRSVLLLDRQQPGREASWAGGGIVSPLYPWNYDDAITQLVRWAQSYYPQLAASLFAETGIDPEFNPCGMYMLDSSDQQRALTWATRVGADVRSVAVEQVRHSVPHLGAGFQQALYMPSVGNVRNPRLLKALLCGLQRHSAMQIYADTEVTRLLVQENRIAGVQTLQGNFYADQVLLAAGAWSPLLTTNLALPLEIKPVKGEMLVFKAEPGLLPAIILHEGKYLIPRADGRIVVGSTTETCGYQKQTSAQGRQSLLSAAYRILPALKNLTIEKHWAGLRPGSPAGLPYMGEVPTIKGLFVCAGHYRNGLVTAPASAQLMVDLICQRPSGFNASAFALDREPVLAEMF